MGKSLKIIALLCGLLLLMLLAAALLAPIFIDPNEHKETIISEVKKATGRDLTINGNIALSLFPWLGLELGETQLSNAEGFGKQPFIALNRAQIRIKLLPLFSKQLVVDTIVVDGLRINLAKNANGTSNWDDMIQHGDQEAATDIKPQQQTEIKQKSSGPTLAIDGVTITNADLLWDDQSTGQRYQIKGVNLQIGEIGSGQPTQLELRFSVTAEQPAITANLTLEGKVTANLLTQKYKIDHLKIDTDLQGKGLPKEGLQITLISALTFDQAKDSIDAPSFTLTAGDLRLNGNLFGQSLSASPMFEGQLKLAKFSPRKLMKEFALSAPVSADPATLTRLSIKTDFRADTKNIALNRLAITLDDSHITGQFKLLNFSQPAYRFKLKLDEIDIDRYLPPATPAEPVASTVAPTGTGVAGEAQLIPVDTLRPLDVEGDLAINKLIIKNIQAQFIKLALHAKAGQLSIDQTIKRFYDGSINGHITLDLRGKQPRLTIVKHAQKIQVEPLIKDISGKEILSGIGNFNTNLTTRGQTISQFKQHLNGNVDFSFNNGALKGINIAQSLREAKAKITGKKSPTHRTVKKTDFSQLSASARIEQGVLHNRDLLMKSPFIRVTGRGQVDLVTETLDYLTRPVVVSNNQGQGGKELKDLVGIPIPVHFSGPWSKLDWKIDMEKIFIDAKKDEAKKKLKKVIEEKIGIDPGKLLKKLF
ncbi:MAG: AsmA family protein [Candidatus Polarisedimenticolaceae bacterium]|nr:AsmA family protein [Candidatus Polarisedimenticolaceae bacterium]